VGENIKISHYSFGKIIIDDKTYTSDVIIYQDHIDTSWWRKEGHRLSVEDISDAINAQPDIMIIGTGYSGMMKVPQETIKFITSKGIEIKVERTEQAVELFNSMPKGKKVITALHLTC